MPTGGILWSQSGGPAFPESGCSGAPAVGVEGEDTAYGGHRAATARRDQVVGALSTNPFDDDGAKFYVVVNDEEQHSLWPVFADIPVGWRVVYGEADRPACLEYVEQSWPDIRPKSLRERLA